MASDRFDKTHLLRVLISGVLVLGLGATFIACGGDDEPASRSFEDEEEAAKEEKAAPKLPKSVKSEIKLTYKKGQFVVDVSGAKLYCLDGREGSILEKPRRGKPDKVGGFKTNEDGFDRVKVKKPGGSYFAELSPKRFAKYGQFSICGAAKSKDVRV